MSQDICKDTRTHLECLRLDGPIKAKKWSGLAFLKDGRTYTGYWLCNSKAECQREIDRSIAYARLHADKDWVTPLGTVKGRDLSHAIPMPVCL